MSKLDSNFVYRYTKQSYDGSTSATKVRATNRKLIYSAYRLSNAFSPPVDDDFFLSCAFTPDDQCLLVGSDIGNVFIFNKYNETLIAKKKVHKGFVFKLVPHKSGDLLLTSGLNSYRHRESALWYIKKDFENLFQLNDCRHAEFTHANDKVLGTAGRTARLYDLNSGEVIHEFTPEVSRVCLNNKAALDHYDQLLLTNGVMFDVRSGKQVHKFYKKYPFMNSVFHTNGLEIICSSEIWDLRTFHLLQSVENLKFCNVEFNNYGDVIFGINTHRQYRSDLEVIDATDYSSITTMKVHHKVRSLAVNPTDTQIAVIESLIGPLVCLFDIGMVQNEEELEA